MALGPAVLALELPPGDLEELWKGQVKPAAALPMGFEASDQLDRVGTLNVDPVRFQLRSSFHGGADRTIDTASRAASISVAAIEKRKLGRDASGKAM